MKARYFSIACASAAIILSSCAHKGDIKQAAVPTPVAQPSPQAEAPKPALQHYIVAKGDCLWTIAAKPLRLRGRLPLAPALQAEPR